MRKEKSAERAQEMARRLVRHWLREDLTKMIRQVIRDQVQAKMTASAQGKGGISNGGLVSLGSKSRSPSPERPDLKDQC